jgi:hypothetical protein
MKVNIHKGIMRTSSWKKPTISWASCKNDQGALGNPRKSFHSLLSKTIVAFQSNMMK